MGIEGEVNEQKCREIKRVRDSEREAQKDRVKTERNAER